MAHRRSLRKRRPELRPSDGVWPLPLVLSGDQRHLGRVSRCALHQPARHPVAGSPDALAFIAWAQISRIGLASCFLSADADVAPKYRSRSQAPSKLHDQPTTDVGPTDWRRLHVRAPGYLYFGRWRQPGWCDDSGSVARPASARTPAGRVARLRVLMMGVVRRSAKGTVDDGESRRCGRGAGLLSPGDDRAARSHPRVRREGRAVNRSGHAGTGRLESHAEVRSGFRRQLASDMLVGFGAEVGDLAESASETRRLAIRGAGVFALREETLA